MTETVTDEQAAEWEELYPADPKKQKGVHGWAERTVIPALLAERARLKEENATLTTERNAAIESLIRKESAISLLDTAINELTVERDFFESDRNHMLNGNVELMKERDAAKAKLYAAEAEVATLAAEREGLVEALAAAHGRESDGVTSAS